jgi:hypothetical protein
MKIKRFIFHGLCSLLAILFINIIYKLDYLKTLIILLGYWILLNQLDELEE